MFFDKVAEKARRDLMMFDAAIESSKLSAAKEMAEKLCIAHVQKGGIDSLRQEHIDKALELSFKFHSVDLKLGE